jgi:D-3-phosphoglycerate dehydrogenase / 2-oxoglutarate reductase
MPRVLIGPAPLRGLHAPFIDTLKAAGFELVYPKRHAQMTEPEILEQLAGIDASLAGSEPYNPKVLAAHPQLKVIARVGVGYDAVDVEECTRRGIPVTIAPNTNQDAVAEHTFALILALAKDLINQHAGTLAQKWPRKATLPLRGRTLGVAGLGRIGKAVATRGLAFGMKVIACDPYPDRSWLADHLMVDLVEWSDVVARSDFLSLHMPPSKDAHHLINAKTLAQMKPTAFLINTARGAIINEPDLVAALKNKTIAGAGIDVFELEPPGDHPLFKFDNVVITPHAAGVDLQSRDDMAMSAAQAIIALMHGDWPAEKIVNPDAKSKFKW